MLDPLQAPVTFHIVYTPGTVRLLLPFARSLLRWSACRFQLVSNGCRREELALLERACRREPRLDLTVLPFRQMVKHAPALNYLYAHSRQPHFCFMDSDILATGDFMAELQPYFADAAGVFTAWPALCTEAEQVLQSGTEYMGGHHRVNAAGLCLGGSYFAIYDRAALEALMPETPDGFERGYWALLPPDIRMALAGLGEQRLFYDTGRILNLLLRARGYTLYAPPVKTLWHIGTFSAFTSHFDKPAPFVPWWRRALRQPVARPVRRLFMRLGRTWRASSPGEQYIQEVRLSLSYDVQRNMLHARRVQGGRYFSALLLALNGQGLRPDLPDLGAPEVEQRVRRLTELLAAEWQAFDLRRWVEDE